MQVKRLVQCPVCGAKYLEGTDGGCPKCGGGKSGVVRSLGEESNTAVAAPYAAQPAGPVFGWLVCVKGERKGEHYRIVNEKTLIVEEKDSGGDKAIRIAVCCEWNGGGVSGMVLFDNVENEFWILNGCGQNVIRVNGKMLTNAIKLKKGDFLEIAGTELAFAPLCGERFKWDS
jgi:hypothetical protein